MSDPLDELYRLPLAEFTRARNQLADAATDREEAARIRKLAKPSVVAWAVNQVYHRDRALYDELLATATEVAGAQASGDPDPLRRSMKARREALDACVSAAGAHLAAAGHGSSPATMQKIARSLEALATWGDADGAPSAGRLAAEVEPPGFDVLAQLAASAPPPRARSTSPPEPSDMRAAQRRAELEEAAREAEAAAKVRAAEHARALEARERAADKARALSAKVEEAAARLAELQDKQAAAQREHRDARAAARRSASAEARARDRLARAKKKLGDLE